MPEEFAVEGLMLLPLGIVIPNTGTVTIVSIPSPVVRCQGKHVYLDPLLFTVVGASAAGYIAGSVQTVGVQMIPKTSTKNRSQGIFVMRDEDTNVVNMLGIPIGGLALVAFTEPWKIDDPAQMVTLGN